MPTFEVKTPVGANQIGMRKQIREAVAEATRRGKLRPELRRFDHRRELRQQPRARHADHPLRAVGARRHRGEADSEGRRLREHERAVLAAGRAARTSAAPIASLEGVRKCILHAVWQAQGKGCSPGAVGVCIGGDRTSGYLHAKEQLFRTLDDVNPDPRLAELEADDHGRRSTGSASGTMGFGGEVVADRLQDRRAQPAAGELLRVGRVRLLGVPPARRRARCARPARSREWLYRDPANADRSPMIDAGGASARTGRESRARRAARRGARSASLKVGDVVLISGRVYTGRDAVHAHLMKHEPPVDLRGGVLYHCGPVVAKTGRRLDGDGGRADDEHPRGAVSGRRASGATACAR